MAKVRVIARLDIKGPNLVKGIHLEGLRVMGKPESFAKYYYEQGADELLYMDVVASLLGRNSLLEFVSRTAQSMFIPLTVGGGLRSIDDIQAVLRAGADKVSLNTAAIHNPNLIREASRRFGSSTIVVSIETIRHADGRYEAFTNNGRDKTQVDAIEWAQRAVEYGAGELMVTSILREGTGKGYDGELIETISDLVPVPVIASGGAGCVSHVSDVIQNHRADAVCVASLLHYEALQHFDINEVDTSEGNIEFLRSGLGFSKIQQATMIDLKKHLLASGIDCRRGGVH